MKIGILTFHLTTNYGALFQAYALRKYLLDNGYDVEFINYQPDYLEAGGKISIKTLFSINTIKILFVRMVTLKEKYFGNKQKKSLFKEFNTQHLGLNNEEIYKTKKALEKANIYYDALITGSDQVWNPPEQFGIDHVFFLNFKTANPNVKKISFAPSFGKSDLNKKYNAEVKNLLLKLDKISVREKSGAKIVENLTGISPIVVPDPTILISCYKSVMKTYTTKSKDYIFCYNLRSRETIGEITEYISSKMDLPIYTPHNPHRRWKEIGETVYPGPSEWLYLVSNSKFIVTNSFHGTMLSILLNKPFIVVGIGSGEKTKYNERAKNILEECGLDDRLLLKYDEKEIDKLIYEEIDWVNTNNKISKLRIIGEDYLSKALENE